MKQFIIKKEPKNNLVELKDDDYKYLVKVRRLAVGESFPALLPDGTEATIKIKSINKNILTGEIKKTSASSAPSFASKRRLCERGSVILFQALPKGDKMDLIVRQAAETGIAGIIPFVSEFSVAKKNISGQKLIRWERIIKEARQQSGSKTATAIREPMVFSELIEYWNTINKKTAGLLFHHQGVEKISLHEYLYNIGEKQDVALAIGPEGGFSDTEAAQFIKNGFASFTIGETILRTETAALYFTAAVKTILSEKNKWQPK